ncbi:hypothetical protein [Aquimarina sp. AU474]|uniref:hypothetical protein n=1 Tax=Aquimarina sp. AU474 TaxID=2108529 RepID=UPI000D69EC05|nr:hypothetical protein [Aquimarina sp. AU474]
MLKKISSLGVTLNRVDLESIKGGRSVSYLPDGNGGCKKVVWNEDGVIKVKYNDRYDGRC